MDRYKMPRAQRAKQFAPFDALKGLKDAIRLKEYEHEKKLKGELSEEKIVEISNTLSNLKKNGLYNVKYYFDGYNHEIIGNITLDLEYGEIEIRNTKIKLEDILDINIIDV